MSKYEFLEMLNDCYPPVDLAGIEYDFGYAMKELDPVRFDVMYSDYCAMLEEEHACLD